MTFEAALTADLRRARFNVTAVILDANYAPGSFPCTVWLQRGAASATSPDEVGSCVRDSLAVIGQPLGRDEGVTVIRRGDRYTVECMLSSNPNPFRRPTRNRFRQRRLWRWDEKHLQVITAWPEVDGRIKRPGEAWHQGCPDLPRNFLVLRMPQLLHDEIEGAPDLEELDLDDGGPIPVAVQRTRSVVYGRHDRRAREGFLRADEAEAAFEFSRSIPSRCLGLARRFHEQNFAVLQALTLTRGTDDLIRSNPALAMMLARPDLFGASDVSNRVCTQGTLIRQRRRVALGQLGFAGADIVEHALRKVPAREVSILNLRKLRDVLRDEAAVNILVHIPALNSSRLKLLLYTWGILSPVLIRRLLMNGADSQVRKYLKLTMDCGRMSQQLGQPWPPAEPINGMRALQRHHDRLVGLVCAQDWLPHLNTPFPNPPLPGTENIVPITSGPELQEESQAMGHCVVSLLPDILAGDLFVYRVTSPERATVAVALTSNTEEPGASRWSFNEIQGPHNREVTPETFNHVTSWLRACNRA